MKKWYVLILTLSLFKMICIWTVSMFHNITCYKQKKIYDKNDFCLTVLLVTHKKTILPKQGIKQDTKNKNEN